MFARFARWAAAPAPASGGGLRIKEANMTQAATIDPAVDLTTPEVDIDLVHVVDVTTRGSSWTRTSSLGWRAA
jgi:hypothetical protein